MNITIKTTLTAILFLAISCKKENNSIRSDVANKSSTSNLTDITANYPSIKIGTQKWMAKNLDVANYRNGDKIPQVKDAAKWAALTTGAWCWYNNDPANAIYGKLYNWYAVNDPRGLAPKGWHVPSDTEWTTLSTYLGEYAGGKMKDTGTIQAGTGLWYAPNTGATNETGFTGFPGGFRNVDGTFHNVGYNGLWWSSTENPPTNAWYRYLYYSNVGIPRVSSPKRAGYSVRCIKN